MKLIFASFCILLLQIFHGGTSQQLPNLCSETLKLIEQGLSPTQIKEKLVGISKVDKDYQGYGGDKYDSYDGNYDDNYDKYSQNYGDKYQSYDDDYVNGYQYGGKYGDEDEYYGDSYRQDTTDDDSKNTEASLPGLDEKESKNYVTGKYGNKRREGSSKGRPNRREPNRGSGSGRGRDRDRDRGRGRGRGKSGDRPFLRNPFLRSEINGPIADLRSDSVQSITASNSDIDGLGDGSIEQLILEFLDLIGIGKDDSLKKLPQTRQLTVSPLALLKKCSTLITEPKSLKDFMAALKNLNQLS